MRRYKTWERNQLQMPEESSLTAEIAALPAVQSKWVWAAVISCSGEESVSVCFWKWDGGASCYSESITNFCLFVSSAWIKVEQLKPYHPHKEEMIKINKGKRFQQAVDAVEEFLRKTKGKDQVSGFFFTKCNKTGLGVNAAQVHFCVKGVYCLWQVEEGFVFIHSHPPHPPFFPIQSCLMGKSDVTLVEKLKRLIDLLLMIW